LFELVLLTRLLRAFEPFGRVGANVRRGLAASLEIA